MAGSGTREIKRRIKSVGNTQKITKALQTVSAVKMRKAQARALAGRPFAETALSLLQRLSGLTVERHPLLVKKETGRQLLVIITPDKGLTGSLISNISRKVLDLVSDQEKNKGRKTDVYTIGVEAESFAKRGGLSIVRSERNDKVDLRTARRLKDDLIAAYLSGPYDKVILAYTQFVSTLKQQPFVRGILPLSEQKIIDVEELSKDVLTAGADANKKNELSSETHELEPSPAALLDELVPDLVTMLLYHVLLEAAASEHSARMIAMKNAHDNAKELIAELTRTFNKLRQESITASLAEISGGVAALETA